MHQETYRGVVKPPTRGVVAIAAGFTLLLATGGLQAATCSIGTTPNPPTINIGQSIAFTGTVTGKAPLTYTWAFAGGTPASATAKSVTVSYASAGSFAATLNGKNGRNETCTANVTVQVNAVGNSPPVAQNDQYNTQQNTSLTVAAPGILGNDNDPNGNPITAVLGTNVAHGALSLNPNGGFTYTPDNGYNGSESFTYQARDSLGATSNLATVTIGIAAAAQVSINSTSADGTLPTTAVQEQSKVSIDPTNAFTLLAINDLGMHCGDQDTRISSILPPFNVLHAQVVQRGRTGLPRVLGEGEVTLSYSAASNPNDPAIAKVASGQALSSVVNGEVYKTNFWDVAFQAYDPFYPPGVLAAFYDPNNPAQNVDIGLPVPDVERLYLGDGQLHATQQAMPGLNNPYSLNEAQTFQEHFTDFPFFINFPFGYVADNVNWFEAAGVPIAMFDDFGRENPYPLVRVQAQQGQTTIASLDTVMPISGEAECQSCHAAMGDGGNGAAVKNLTTINFSIDDPLEGSVPSTASVEWASDLNILRLHDQKHGTSLLLGFDATTGRAAKPVVCQSCHYTPALDLAQVGPNEVNGRDQVKHKSMSNVMHSHHATATGVNGNPLFPTMPPAIDGQGNRRDPVQTQTILEQTCYMCHPGNRTQCMRGAMANAGLVCQDCHGQMAQVGNDFSRDVSPSNPGAFHLAADFYDNPATPRVPWANEPGCGSCHTGYATSNLAGTAGTLVNPTDTLGNRDGIRLLTAYLAGDAKATPIVPNNKAFAENVVAEGGAADGNPKLYRVSTGHGGLFCEACHGSTHAEWPSSNPNANDNIPAKDLQGHSGYIAECQVCHEPTDASLPLGNNGPHGMHAITDLQPAAGTGFLPDDRWNIQHRNYRNTGPGCESCHGTNLTGTVLSRTADDRTVRCKTTQGSLPECKAGQTTAVIPKGTPVGCGMCHRQK
ncbi:MAG: cadherin-like domain-containing protein [Chromatiaceae bacterium]|nr:cadherin-like domain-containing protein [Chromatiaceae bacterium]